MKKLLFLIGAAIIFCSGYSQSSLDDFKFRIYYKTTSTDTAVFDSVCTRMCKIHLEDTTNIAFVKVKIGTTKGAHDILQYDFAFDVTTGLPQGLSYFRKNKKIYLGLLKTTRSDLYHYQIQLQDNQGNLSSPKQWF